MEENVTETDGDLNGELPPYISPLLPLLLPPPPHFCTGSTPNPRMEGGRWRLMARATSVRAARRLQDPRRVAGQIAHARIDLRDSHPYRSHVVSGQLKLLLEKIIARWSPARLEL